MKVTNRDLFAARAPLQALVNTKLPVSVSFKLARVALKINEQYQVIEEVRSGLIKKYGTVNEEGQVAVVETDADFPKFLEEFNELMSIEVEMVIDKVKLPTEVDGKPLEIEPVILMALEKFIEV